MRFLLSTELGHIQIVYVLISSFLGFLLGTLTGVSVTSKIHQTDEVFNE